MSYSFDEYRLVPILWLQNYLCDRECLPLKVGISNPWVYPDANVPFVEHKKRSADKLNVSELISKLREMYPGLTFQLPFHGKTLLGTARKNNH